MSRSLYAAYGRVLETSLALPELHRASVSDGDPHWTFNVVEDLPPMRAPEQLGEDPLYSDVSARLYRHEDGYRITVDDTGHFELGADGREISWLPLADPWWDFGRGHLIGRVLAMALHLEGWVTLHASAVELGDGVVGFVAPKHFGKSTLALNLVRAGARFVTDDALPISISGSLEALPGIPSLRIRPEAPIPVDLVDEARVGDPGRDEKRVLPPMARHRLMRSSSPLSALYFLAPRDPSGHARAADRRRLPSPLASMRLMGNFKIGSMLGSAFAQDLLDAATTVVSAVPVHDLEISQDLDLLPDVVGQIIDWHGPVAEDV